MSRAANWLDRLPWRMWGPYLKLRFGGGGLRQFRKSNVGKYSYVDPSVQIFGWEQVTVGTSSVLSEGVWLNASRRGASSDRIVVGNNCHVGRRNYFSTGGLIEIRDFGFTGIDCHLLGCSHNADDPYTPYLLSGLTDGAPIVLGVNAWLTTSVTVLEGVHIGCGSMIGARSVVRSSIPPYSVAVGNPCVVVKRFDFKNNRWISTRNYLDELDAFCPTEREYLERLRDKQYAALPALHASSSRFGWLR